jgi:hypothetical protein
MIIPLLLYTRHSLFEPTSSQNGLSLFLLNDLKNEKLCMYIHFSLILWDFSEFLNIAHRKLRKTSRWEKS